MKCRRICRELLWLSRFGELGPSSQPHLDHLAGCRACRDEVGFDRAMVEQLRIALAARIENAAPSSAAWERILVRAQAPEPAPAIRLWQWSTAVVGRLRFATAMAGTGLALLLALNTQVVGLPGTTDSSTDWERSTLQQVPRMPREQSALAQLTQAWASNTDAGAQRPDPESVLTVVSRPPMSTEGGEPDGDPVEAPAAAELRLVIRPLQTPEPARGASASIEPDGAAWQLAPSQPGEPS
jgi:hypothetical protein